MAYAPPNNANARKLRAAQQVWDQVGKRDEHISKIRFTIENAPRYVKIAEGLIQSSEKAGLEAEKKLQLLFNAKQYADGVYVELKKKLLSLNLSQRKLFLSCQFIKLKHCCALVISAEQQNLVAKNADAGIEFMGFMPQLRADRERNFNYFFEIIFDILHLLMNQELQYYMGCFTPSQIMDEVNKAKKFYKAFLNKIFTSAHLKAFGTAFIESRNKVYQFFQASGIPHTMQTSVLILSMLREWEFPIYKNLYGAPLMASGIFPAELPWSPNIHKYNFPCPNPTDLSDLVLKYAQD